MSSSVFQLCSDGKNKLAVAGIENAEFEAYELAAAVLKTNRMKLLLMQSQEVKSEQQQAFFKMVDLRIKGEPLQYIIGEWSFLGNVFSVGRGVLIPRPETEQLADICIKHIKKSACKNVFDLCSGTGCIGISIAKACPGVKVWLFELYDDAYKYLTINIKNSGLTNVSAVKYNILDGFSKVLPNPDVIVSNPPYIKTDELSSLQKEVQKEPLSALDGGDDGLIFYKSIAKMWCSCITPGGLLAMECGENQANVICDMLTGMHNISVESDIYGINRFITAVK